MKKYFFVSMAMISAIALSAFTTSVKNTEIGKKLLDKDIVCKYLVFNLAGTSGETVFSNYTPQDTKPVASTCPSDGKICWILICYDNSSTTLEAAFNAYIASSDVQPNGQISDDLNEDHTTYEEKQ